MPRGAQLPRFSRALFVAGTVLLVSWAICYETGKSLPYLQTERSFQLRMYLLYPLLVLPLIWFAFFHRWKETGKSGYRMAMDKLDSPSARLKNTVVGLLGLIAIPAAFAWSTAFYAAWAAYLLSHQAFSETYRIVDVRAVSNYWELDLEATSTREQVALPVRTHAWRAGEVVCAHGRSSALGFIVESINANECAKNAT
jgi:hypothetical protein